MMGKVAVAGISLILVVGIIIGVVATVSRGNGSTTSSKQETVPGISTGMKAVETLCAPTDYKDACMNTLVPIAKKDDNVTPKDLVHATFQAIIDDVNKAFNKTSLLEKDATTDQAKQRLSLCKELLTYAIQDVEAAATKILDSEMHTFGELAADYNNWLSAVLAYKYDCMDGLEDIPELKKGLQDELTNVTQLTSNGLAIIVEIANTLSKINATIPLNLNQQQSSGRRLLGAHELDKDGYPTWVSAGDRKLLAAKNNQIRPNVVVAKDGSGQFKSINQALAAYPKNLRGRYTIHVKAGVYREKVLVQKNMINVFMYGDGPRKTIITWDDNDGIKGIKTFSSYTFGVLGSGFIAKGMTFKNTAGPAGKQAVALLTSAEGSTYYGCKIDGYQDSLYYHSQRSFFRDCVISGTVDFIFGSGSSVIQNSRIFARLGGPTQKWNTITADGRKDRNSYSGLVLQNCQILAERKLVPQMMRVKTYLGRPWTPTSHTMIMESDLGNVIAPEGWLLWDNAKNHETCELKEYANRGPSANTSGRVKWRTLQIVTDRRGAEHYTVGNFLKGGQWIATTGAPHYLGFSH